MILVITLFDRDDLGWFRPRMSILLLGNGRTFQAKHFMSRPERIITTLSIEFCFIEGEIEPIQLDERFRPNDSLWFFFAS